MKAIEKCRAGVRFEKHHAMTLPLSFVIDMCSKKRTRSQSKDIDYYMSIWNRAGRGPAPISVGSFIRSAKEWAESNLEELEDILMNRSTASAVTWATRNGRLLNEKKFMELCRNTELGRKHWAKYCYTFMIIPENHAEIMLEATFGNSANSKEYVKKIQRAKRKCRSFIIQLMKSDGVSENDLIRTLLEKLET